MDIELYMPCQPDWLCQPFLSIFSVLLLIGLLFFVRIIYREYKNIQRTQELLRRRRQHYRDRMHLPPLPKRKGTPRRRSKK
jgi:hypothetical protein